MRAKKIKLIKEKLNEESSSGTLNEQESLNASIKTFDEVKVGDPAFRNSDFEFEGNVLAKGTFDELYDKYESAYGREELEEIMDEEEIDDLECVAVSQDPKESLEGFRSQIFVYNTDPSSVFCIKISR
ncbi:MAG: hypothetical protein ACOC1O_00560 [bacterium]